MNYYQITSGLDELDDSDESDNDTEAQSDAKKTDPKRGPPPPATPPHLHQAVTSCLAQDTVADLGREYARNISNSSSNNSNNNSSCSNFSYWVWSVRSIPIKLIRNPVLP